MDAGCVWKDEDEGRDSVKELDVLPSPPLSVTSCTAVSCNNVPKVPFK